MLDFGGRDLGITNALYVSPVDARGFVVLTGDGSPLVVNEPSDTAGFSGDRLRLVAKVGGTRPLTLQWLKDGTPMPGATNAVLRINNARSTDAGSYQLTATNALGGAASRVATLRVIESAPVLRRIALEPTTHTPFIGGAATLYAEVVGSAPMSFQWLFEGAPIAGATNSTLLLDNFRELRGFGFKSFSRLKTRQDKGHARQFALFAEAVKKDGPPLIPWTEIANSTRASLTIPTAIAERRWIEI